MHFEIAINMVLHEKTNITAYIAEPLKVSKWVLHMQFGYVVAKLNEVARFKAFLTLKMLYTGCSTKEAI